jgi:hypothetical protein
MEFCNVFSPNLPALNMAVLLLTILSQKKELGVRKACRQDGGTRLRQVW